MFKVFGVQRTGTTYMRELLKQNFGVIVLTNELGWKHGMPVEPWQQLVKDAIERKYTVEQLELVANGIKNGIHAVIMIKSPYTWVCSIEKWARNAWKKEDLSTWTAKKYVDLYNGRYSGYLSFYAGLYCYKTVTVVRYEDLLRNFGEQMSRISQATGLHLKQVVNINKVQQSDHFTEEKRQYYLKPRGRKDVTDAVNWEVIKKYGYEPIKEA